MACNLHALAISGERGEIVASNFNTHGSQKRSSSNCSQQSCSRAGGRDHFERELLEHAGALKDVKRSNNFLPV